MGKAVGVFLDVIDLSHYWKCGRQGSLNRQQSLKK